MLDLKIEGATVLDGTGAAGNRTDVGVRDETIVAIGDLNREHAGTTLNASGKVLAPGFIDMHSHSDWRLWANGRAESKIRQGVTTEVVGNCGFSPAPFTPEFREDLRGFALYVPPGMDFAWPSFGDYLRAFDTGGTALNVVHLVGHGTLRIAAMGFARRAPSDAELTTMKRLMGSAVNDGAWGLSTGLIYAPGSYATTEEIVEVARVAGHQGGFYASHIRGEGATLLEAVAEAIRSGARRGCRSGSHVKAAGRRNWGRSSARVRLITPRARTARRDGGCLSVYCVEHHPADAAARLGARGRRGRDDHAPGRRRCARAHPQGAGGAGDGAEPARPHRLGQRDDLLLRQAQGRRGQAAVGDRRRRGMDPLTPPRAHRPRGGQGY